MQIKTETKITRKQQTDGCQMTGRQGRGNIGEEDEEVQICSCTISNGDGMYSTGNRVSSIIITIYWDRWFLNTVVITLQGI